ncbi:MAG: DegT/DnrJ/EryC1/StrS family aminotransferase [Alphaproteobacteria bacterium]
MPEAVLNDPHVHVLRSGKPMNGPRWARPALTTTLVSKPYLSPRAMAYVQEVLESGWWGYGPVCKDLQAEVETLYDGKTHALATSSCTAAMHLSLRALGVGPGDEVIVPAFTYVSTAIVATYCGAEPVFADVDPETLTITADTVAPLLTERTRAIIAMHYAGPAADFDPIRALVRDRNIAVIEDAAHAFGSVRDGQRVGAKADFAAFSFAPTKQVASSNGGLLLFKDGDRRVDLDQLAFLGLAVDTFGRTVAKGVSPVQEVVRLGNKYKGDDLAAAVAFAAVERLDEIVAYRGELVDRFYERLADIKEVQLQPRHDNSTISWYIMPIRVPADRRDALRAHLAAADIGNTVHYPNLREQKAFLPFRGEVPVTAEEARRVISLPLHEMVSLTEVDRICDEVALFFRQ